MALVCPFRSLQYALEKTSIQKVVTQPYDKISPAMQEQYYASHPNNIVRIVFGRHLPEDNESNNVYTRAGAYLGEWRGSGILQQLPEPAFFVYFQRFVVPGEAEVRLRKGFVGLGKLEDYSNRIVFPHERTLSGPKKDRLELLRRTRTQFEQIFMLYEDPDRVIDAVMNEIALRPPDIKLTDEYSVEHTMWTVMDADKLEFIQQQMADKRLIIADGHHRYETALAYRDEMRGELGSDWIPMCFFNIHSPGLSILPTHRVVQNLPAFDSTTFFQKTSQFFDAGNAGSVSIDVVTADQVTSLGLKASVNLASLMPDLSEKQRELDVVILHRLILERCLGISEDAVKKESYIRYVRERDAAVNAVRDGKAQIAFLLNPTRLDQMRDVAYAGDVMPQKSTDFYPKVLSGLTMYSMDS